jgi:hypothetical protein
MATSKDFKVKNGLNVNSTSILKATGTNYTDGALLILDSTGSTTAAITNNGSGLYISKDTVGSVAAISLLSTGINLTGNVITTGSIQTKAPTISSLITGATSGAIEIPVVANISVPTHATFLHQTTGVSTGYIQHVSLGSYRSGGPGWDSFYIGIGGNDAYPTNKFSFGFDGSLIHSGTGTFLNASNYNTWAPSLTGVGASGTWNINTNGAHNGTVGATAPNTGVFTTIATSGNVTIGTSSSINSLYINGTGSGTGGGAASVVQNNGTPVIAIGNKSALMGGTYNATPMLYGVTAIETNVGLTVGGTITTGIIAASTVTAVLTKNQFDPSFHLSSKSGVNLGAAGSEMARFGLNYNNSWDSFTQYLRGSSSQNGSQVLWAGNTSVVTVTSTGISVVGAINTNNKICVTADTTTPTDGSAYFYKSSTGSVVSGYQVILETGSAGSRTTKATLDNNGNFVLGNITASAWNTAAGPALQIDHASISHAGGFDVTDFSTNAYFVYGTGYKYIGNAIATKYTQTAGRHRFYSSVSGTANTIVSFIEGMNLDENSKLNIRGELAAGTGLNSANFSLSGVPVLGVNAGTGINYLRGDTLEFQNNAGNVTRAILKDTGLSVTSVYDPTITRITNPGGGSYVTGIASVTGALKIVLPVGMTGTMIRMTIKVYEYNSAGSFEINCGGYNYPTGNTWANNPFAYIINTPGVNRNYNVRFGYTAGGKAVIYIGELNTVWNYPQVFVTDVQLGYGGYGTPFATGWVVGVEPTAFENVTTTVSNTQVSLPSSVVGSALGVAAVGSSMAYARADHVHQIPANVVAAGAAGFMTGADKTKLDGIATGANNYTHPANHAPSIITQDASNRFVTDAEKTTWNAKQSALGFNPVQQGTGTNQGSNLIKMGWGTGPNTGKVALTIDSTDFGYTWPININGGASMLTNSRTINRTAFNGTANIECTEWFHSGRDFPLGTTIYTDINYANTDGDPFVLEIKGNSYGNLKPFDIQYQGYIYSNSVINHGGISNGTNIPGLVLLNVGGLLTFWFPTMGYWQGFNVRVYRATLSGSYNAVTSIVNSAKPTGTKEVALSANIVQSWHSGNLTISGVNTGDQTTITGNAGSATVLQTARTINGVSFNGSANITINAVDSTARIASSEKGAANGVATLDGSGLVPTGQLPSYVDDVLEYANLAALPGTGVAGKIYVALDTNKTYRWGGSSYVYITSGAVDSVAGKTGIVSLVKADVGLGSVDNTADASKPVSTAQATAIGLKADLNSPTLTGIPAAPTAAVSTNTTQLATTAFVNAEIANDAPTKVGGGASGTWSISVTGNAGNASRMVIADRRAIVQTPGYFGVGADLSFMSNATDGLSDGGQYHGIMHLQPYSDASGGGAYELGFTDNNNLWLRGSSGALTTWGTWNKIYHTGNVTISGSNTGDETLATIKSKLGITTLSGSNTGDETLATIKSKLGITTLSGSNTGDQTTITGNAGSATKIISQGSYAAAAVGTTRGPAGINLFDNYGGGYPIPYGNVLHIAGGGGGQLLVGWSGSDGAHADNYVRSKRDNDTGAWSPWAKIYTDVNLTNLNQLANGPGYATGGGTASGTNTGDETLATIKSKLGITTLSGANTGDQTNITGSAGSAARLSEQTAYTMLHATLPTATPMGATVTFVGPAVGEGTWPNYGSLVHIRSYASGGGTMQMLAPYGVSQGGTGLKIRFGDYDTNGGNAWTAWKTVWDSVNLTNLNQLTNGPGYITSAGSISGTAAYATAISGVASQIGYSTSAVAIAYTSTGGPQIMGQSTGAAMLSFHRPGAYAINFGLDTDNVLKVGGWSAGAVSYKIWHEGNDGAGSGLDADLLDGQSSAYYQAALVSGTNIKTINGTTLLGSGNIVVSASAATSTVLGTVYANMDISSNCAVGYEALWYNTGSNGCTAFGIGALRANTTGSYNAALGNNALRANTTGSYNVAIGINALSTNTTGNNNLAIGYRALRYNTTGQSNIAFGYDSLTANTIGNNNLAIGNYALLNNTTGINNTAIGYQSLQMNTTGIYNTGIGIWTLKNNTIGTYNLAVGESSLTSNTTGSNNTAIGVSSLFSNTTGSNNTAIGRGAGTLLTTGVNNTIIGFGANSASETTSNSITLGNASITSLRCNVQSISALSDKRDKTGIVDIGLGMEFISTLKPVKFHWDRREWYTDGVSDGTKSITEFDYGFIAQDLKAAQEAANVPDLNLVLQDNPDRLEATPGRLLPIMVKALQEANTRIEKLEALVAQLLAK